MTTFNHICIIIWAIIIGAFILGSFLSTKRDEIEIYVNGSVGITIIIGTSWIFGWFVHLLWLNA